METSSIVVDVLKIADIDRVNVSAELARALIGHHTYLDTICIAPEISWMIIAAVKQNCLKQLSPSSKKSMPN
jgi:hypothetical protein